MDTHALLEDQMFAISEDVNLRDTLRTNCVR
jgi:hypothetical protein